MSHMNPELKARVEANPQQKQAVVITAAQGEEQKVSSLLRDAETTEIFPGVHYGQISGERLLEMEEDDTIDAIDPDEEVRALEPE